MVNTFDGDAAHCTSPGNLGHLGPRPATDAVVEQEEGGREGTGCRRGEWDGWTVELEGPEKVEEGDRDVIGRDVVGKQQVLTPCGPAGPFY